MSEDQRYAPPNSRLSLTAYSRGQSTPVRARLLGCHERGQNEQNLLDRFVNRGTLAARILQGSLEGSIISMNVNPSVADVISEGKK